MKLLWLGEKNTFQSDPACCTYRHRQLWRSWFKDETSTQHPWFSVLKEQTYKYTPQACTPHRRASAVALGSWGWAWWGREMLLLVAKLWGIQEAQRARSIANILTERCFAWYPCYWGIAGSRGWARWCCLANICLLRHLPRNTVDASQHPVVSRLCDLHLTKPCLVAEGWCLCTHYQVSQGAFSLGSGLPSLVCCSKPALGTAFPFLSSGRYNASMAWLWGTSLLILKVWNQICQINKTLLSLAINYY